MTILAIIVGAVLGFVAGILVGRRNVQHVEMALDEAKTQYVNLLAEIKKKANK